MSDSDTEALVHRCAATEQAAQQALKWFHDYPDQIAAQRPVLEKEFRLAAVEARKLRIAAERPVAVGVYGLSQAGKSYLISTLARPTGGALIAELDRPRPFIADINPESEKEATGLVTRFTMRREPAPEGFPVRLRLLSETELVMILANSWYCDARDAVAVLPDAIAETLAAAEREATRAGGEIIEEDIWELQTYWDNEFRSVTSAQAFQGTFWDRAAAVLPRLPLDKRVDVYALLWNRYAPFTDVLRRLTARLHALRFERTAYAPIAALVPKTESVLKVDTLDRLIGGSDEPLEIVGASGGRCTLSRPELTALIAELQITMQELPWPLLQDTDLLDFPGARERKGMDIAQEVAAYPEKLGEFFLRGKVAFLFERYAAERELNALLLCIKESNNPYDKTIRQAIRNWVNRTHGERPEDRVRVATALFVVLTRMDMHFNRTEGRSDDARSDDLWEARIKASLEQPLQEANGWLDNWHPGQAFDNTLLARNPSRSQSLSELEGGREVAYKPDIEARIARWGKEFAAHPSVRRYVRDAARAWKEVFRLNDAGMEYLVERLAPVCNPRLKLSQVATQIDRQREAMHRRLSEWHVSDDKDSEYAKHMAALEPAITALEACGDSGRFGHLLMQFHLDPAEAREVLLRTTGGAEGRAGAPPAATRGGAISDLRRRIVTGQSVPAAQQVRRDAAEERAEALLSAWIAKVRRFAQEPVVRLYFGFEAAPADALAAELIGSVTRMRTAPRLAESLRRGGTTERFDLAAERHAVAAAQIINEQVNYLGLRVDGVLRPERPRLGEDGPMLFEPPVPAALEIEDEPPPYAAYTCVSWIEALVLATYDNVYSQGGGGLINRGANDALGAVLRLL